MEIEENQKEGGVIDNNNIIIKTQDKNNFDDNSIKKHILNHENKYCLCLSHRNSLCNSIDFYRMNSTFYNNFNSLKESFEKYKKLNNGIFPLILLENMLKELNVIPSLIDLIKNFIEKKAQKGIITFELFKEILSILTIPLDDEEVENNKQIFTDGLFLLFSYPNDYIEKSEFCSFLQLTNKDYSLKYINNILNKFEIPKSIKKEKFKELIDFLIDRLIESLEHIKYLPYIFFDLNISDKKNEKNCIDILLNGKDIKEYVIEKIQTENNFYIIDYKFWENWNQLINSKNYEELNNLKIHTENISDQNGKINEGLVYLKDYVILTKKIYDLFCKWYGNPLIEIEREKIYIEDEDEKRLNRLKLNKEDKEKCSFLQVEDLKTHKKYEIEIYPVFLVFLNFEEVQLRCHNSFSKFKEEIKAKLEKKDTILYKFSRKEKFSKLFSVLQDNLRMELDENNSRLWILYQDVFEKVQKDESLEIKGIYNKAAILLEINKSGSWPIDEFDSIKNELKIEDISPTGIMNIGNSCYMNSILQILLNISEIKNIFINKKFGINQNFLNFLINYKSEKCVLVEEFINLLIDKWIERKKTLSPKKFKQVCGRFNENFKGFNQQDANDFFNYLIQSLHEGTNIKTNEIDIINKEIIDTNEIELGNEYWANTIRNNASYIYSLFMGQFQSKLICSKCHKCKIKYEPYSILDLPLPEENNIILYIKLFRLPLSLSPFLNDNKEINIKKINLFNYQNKNEIDKNKNKGKFDISINEQLNLELETNKKLEVLNKSSSEDELIKSQINLNIPIKLRIEISRKEQCEEIISNLKSMNELSLDINNKYTKFIIVSNNKNINPYLTIDEALESLAQVDVYELLNYEGIKETYNYKDLISDNPEKLNIKEIYSTIDLPNNNYINYSNNIEESEFKEILIEIKHRVRKNIEGDDYLINMPVYSYFQTYRDFIILANKKSIKIYDLYEMMWEKYKYFCDIPANLKNNLWWRNISNCKNEIEENKNLKNENEITAKRFCSPFLLKVVNKLTKSCEYCPWFRLCNGCILDPNYAEYFSIPKNCYLIVEWCRKVKFKQIKNENPLLCFNHSSIINNNKEENKIFKKHTIYDCFDLFTKKEIVEDVLCENCGEKRDFSKVLKIERIPKYLIISLKRFKYTMMYEAKINSPIQFPLNNINLNNYLVENSNENSKIYDLFAIVNHIGTLSCGHYHTIIKFNDKWIKFNDSTVSYFTRTFDSQDAYILIYKYIKEENFQNFKFNFSGLMDTAFKIYCYNLNFEHIFNYLLNEKGEIIEEYEKDCKYYYGEPVTVNKTKGYLVNIYQKDDDIYAKIKIDKDYLNIKYEPNIIIKETIKDNNVQKSNNDKDTVYCNNGCYIL